MCTCSSQLRYCLPACCLDPLGYNWQHLQICAISIDTACPCCRGPLCPATLELHVCIFFGTPAAHLPTPSSFACNGMLTPSPLRVQAANAVVTLALQRHEAAFVQLASLAHIHRFCRWHSRGNNSKSSNSKCSRMQISRKSLPVMLWWMLLLRRPPAMAMGQEMALHRMAPLVENRRAKKSNRRRARKQSRQSGEIFVSGSVWDWCCAKLLLLGQHIKLCLVLPPYSSCT